ncbi:hypothetical protein LCGC14_1462170 [marine sediment metagenome]|uniref:Uncharacterized protein n=1 Tax=marine sediment metagenome TaxID=412755 RepID=A0A0F9K0V8_9ZZZZ
MTKHYINGEEISERLFKIKNYLYNPLNHYVVISDKISLQWGRVPGIFIKKKENDEKI